MNRNHTLKELDALRAYYTKVVEVDNLATVNIHAEDLLTIIDEIIALKQGMEA